MDSGYVCVAADGTPLTPNAVSMHFRLMKSSEKSETPSKPSGFNGVSWWRQQNSKVKEAVSDGAIPIYLVTAETVAAQGFKGG